jgi:hypothetical protein
MASPATSLGELVHVALAVVKLAAECAQRHAALVSAVPVAERARVRASTAPTGRAPPPREPRAVHVGQQHRAPGAAGGATVARVPCDPARNRLYTG